MEAGFVVLAFAVITVPIILAVTIVKHLWSRRPK